MRRLAIAVGLAALAAIAMPASALAVSQAQTEGEFVYECQITETCKTSGCTPINPARQVTLKRVEGQSKGVVLSDGHAHEAHVFRGLGAQEFLQITAKGSIGYTVKNGSGKLAIRATGGQQKHERGVCLITE